MIRRALLTLVLFASSCSLRPAFSQDIRLPEILPAPTPIPVPNPGSVPRLPADILYVISSAKPFIVLASPDSLLTVSQEMGPLAIRGKFIETPDKSVTKRITDPYIAIIEAMGSGRAEIIVVPVGVQREADIVRRMIDADVGPRPPPVPPTPPDPPTPPKPPVPPPPPVVKSFRVIIVAESAKTLTAQQNSVISGKAVRDYLTANTTPENGFAGWRYWDPDVNTAKETPTMQALWTAVKPKLTGLLCFAVEVNGNVEIVPLPATPADAVAMLAKYKGGQ